MRNLPVLSHIPFSLNHSPLEASCTHGRRSPVQIRALLATVLCPSAQMVHPCGDVRHCAPMR
eukprot:352703-Chlamydomonas_euryale.AAC.3